MLGTPALFLRTAPRLLLPVPKFEWREPSLAQPKDEFGNQDRVRFVLRGWQRDGGLIREDWFDDRDELDHALWRIAIEEPHPEIRWEFATVTTLVASAGSSQSWTRPTDFNAADNLFETLAAGGSGAVEGNESNKHGTGAGGGAYSAIANFNAAASEIYQIGAGGAGGGGVGGLAGGDTWLGGADLAGSDVGAKGGSGGLIGSGSRNGGAGGDAASGVGTTKRSGGRGGNLTGANGRGGSGGGGAAGRNAAGNNGGDSASTSSVATDGGAGDGGAGGTAGTGSTSANGGSGGSSTSIGGTLGPGGGGGGCTRGSSASARAGAGGNYGSGGGGAVGESIAYSGVGKQGGIVITYTPQSNGGFFL